jgi:hypothetical protein
LLLVYLMEVAGDALHAESSSPGSAARVARAWNGKVFTDRPERGASPGSAGIWGSSLSLRPVAFPTAALSLLPSPRS